MERNMLRLDRGTLLTLPTLAWAAPPEQAQRPPRVLHLACVCWLFLQGGWYHFYLTGAETLARVAHDKHMARRLRNGSWVGFGSWTSELRCLCDTAAQEWRHCAVSPGQVESLLWVVTGRESAAPLVRS